MRRLFAPAVAISLMTVVATATAQEAASDLPAEKVSTTSAQPEAIPEAVSTPDEPVAPKEAAASAPVTESAPAEAGGYEIRLRSLQERVDDLKSRTFDSKTKLLLLREQILHNLVADARAVIHHVNSASALMSLDEALYFMDNEKIYYQSNQDGVLDSKRDFVIWEGSIAPGNHLLAVELVYRGNGKVFTYLNGYVFRVKSSFTFFAGKGQETNVRVIGFESGGLANKFVDRPSVKFEVQQRKLSMEQSAEGGASQATPMEEKAPK